MWLQRRFIVIIVIMVVVVVVVVVVIIRFTIRVVGITIIITGIYQHNIFVCQLRFLNFKHYLCIVSSSKLYNLL